MQDWGVHRVAEAAEVNKYKPLLEYICAAKSHFWRLGWINTKSRAAAKRQLSHSFSVRSSGFWWHIFPLSRCPKNTQISVAKEDETSSLYSRRSPWHTAAANNILTVLYEHDHYTTCCHTMAPIMVIKWDSSRRVTLFHCCARSGVNAALGAHLWSWTNFCAPEPIEWY